MFRANLVRNECSPLKICEPAKITLTPSTVLLPRLCIVIRNRFLSRRISEIKRSHLEVSRLRSAGFATLAAPFLVIPFSDASDCRCESHLR